MAADPKKPSWRTVIKRMDPDYLYAEDLGGPGTTADVEITDSGKCVIKNPGGKKETLYLAFRGKRKKLGLNATMAKTLTSLFGSDYWGDWRGWITLVVLRKRLRDPTTDDLEDMDVIRIAPDAPRRAPTTGGSRDAAADDPPRPMTPEEQAKIEQLEREGKS